MSLIKQLWIAVIGIVLLAFISGLLVSGIQARGYYEEQLTVKNIDAANSISLTLSPMDKDPITVELALSSQFDTGHYRSIKLIDPEGEEIFIKLSETESMVPAWFANLIKFEIPVGVAQVNDGWNLYGTLFIESETEYALAALWNVFLGLIFWFSVVALIAGLLGSLMMYFVTLPLGKVISQAKALGERRFITSEEPKTIEFKRLVQAMNNLTGQVRGMLEKEASKYDDLKEKSLLDPTMKIANRQNFMETLRARLNSDEPSQDSLLVMRLIDLEGLNTTHGYLKTDNWLLTLAEETTAFLDDHSDYYSQFQLGRLNGKDVAIFLADNSELKVIAEGLLSHLQAKARIGESLPILMVAEHFYNTSEAPKILASIDQSIGLLETTGHQLSVAEVTANESMFTSREEWRSFLQAAIDDQQVFAEYYPVLNMDGTIYHHEAMMRVSTGLQNLPAYSVIGWAHRAGLLAELEIAVVKNVLAKLINSTEEFAINLSANSLKSQDFHQALLALLVSLEAEQRSRLAFELDEYSAVKEPVLFSIFVQKLKELNVKVGLQTVGKQFSQIQDIESLGLEYLKVDASLVNASDENATLLSSLCTLGHSLGFSMIAEGVRAGFNQQNLLKVGFDGVTGPGTQGMAK